MHQVKVFPRSLWNRTYLLLRSLHQNYLEGSWDVPVEQLTFPIHVLKRQGPREMVNQGRGEQGEKRAGEGQDHRLPIAIAREVRPPVGRTKEWEADRQAKQQICVHVHELHEMDSSGIVLLCGMHSSGCNGQRHSALDCTALGWASTDYCSGVSHWPPLASLSRCSYSPASFRFVECRRCEIRFQMPRAAGRDGYRNLTLGVQIPTNKMHKVRNWKNFNPSPHYKIESSIIALISKSCKTCKNVNENTIWMYLDTF
jgi:hypothetical protein